jgi:hypothetical protein
MDMIHGSEAHKDLFCRHFIDTHLTFDARTLPWPELDDLTIERLRAIPFWSVAVAAERNAGKMVTLYAQTIEDPLIREALAVQGVEETRHAQILAEMLARYDVPVAEKPEIPASDRERAFLDFGYEECIDAFFGFGIFGLARAIQLFIPELTNVFEIVLKEEARHVTFFVNWIAYERIRRGRGAAAFVAVSTTLGYLRAVKRIVSTFAPGAKDGPKVDGVGFGAEGVFAIVAENEKYMAEMPRGLLTPAVLPGIAKLALSIPSLPKFGPRKKAFSAVS